jgi:hypothetical protein
MMLGFGVGVTFQSDRDARIFAGMASAQQSERAPQKKVEPPPESVLAPQPSSQNAVASPAASPAAPPVAAARPAAAAARPPEAAPPASPALALTSYAYVYRYEKDGVFGYDFKVGKFENVSAARVAAISACQQKGGRNCKFNFAPPGLCIAVARPPSGQYRVSEPLPDEDSASSDARDLCLQDHSSGCRIDKVLCP